VRFRVIVVASAALAVLPLGLVACGDDEPGGADGTLPPMLTTTTTTSTTTTTTIYVPVTYVIQPGDELFVIASQFGVSSDDLMNLNGIDDPDRIEAGDTLVIPQATLPTTTTEA
jgi:LysM repeat protein